MNGMLLIRTADGKVWRGRLNDNNKPPRTLLLSDSDRLFRYTGKSEYSKQHACMLDEYECYLPVDWVAFCRDMKKAAIAHKRDCEKRRNKGDE